MEFTAKQLAQVLHGTVDGDPQTKVSDIAKIEHGKPGQLCFYANPNTSSMSIPVRPAYFW